MTQLETPERTTRKLIDELLIQAGWAIQNREEFNRTAALGVAVREVAMDDGTFADYLLFIEGKALGIIEAKKAGVSLSGVETQSQGYSQSLPNWVRNWVLPLPLLYESNGSEIFFKDTRDKVSRSRRIFAFHKPETLLEWMCEPLDATLRNRLLDLPPLNSMGLRECQIEAITKLEKSLAENRQKALIQMSTGAGKTYTACNFIYRLLKYADAKRVLFLVDRNNLGRQTKSEFSNFITKDDNRKFVDTYIVQHLQHNSIDKDAKVVITTIQRLYSMLRGEADYSEVDEEISSYEMPNVAPPKDISYNSNFPIEYFDFIVVDECHRSIYGNWRQVLEYFDAFIIGLTATPSKQTFGYFNKNLVSEYPYERSVVDGVNVDYQVLRIKTEVSEYGGLLDKSFPVLARERKTRRTIYEQLDEDLPYEKNALDRKVLNPNQIRTIIETYKQSLFTELFPEREPTWIPKTLIFAKDDHHAEEIVRIVRDVFGADNDFCKKITYNVSGVKPEELISEFRISPKFRIAVTVDMIATGTDIKPLEVLIFMRDVHSDIYFEQMRGRGCRTQTPSDFQSVTPNAISKNQFYIIDAIGVTESKKIASQPLERKRSVSLKKLVEQIAQGKNDDDILSTVAGRLINIERNLSKDDINSLKNFADGKQLSVIAKDLLEVIDPDLTEGKTLAEIEKIKDVATKSFNSPTFRVALLDMATKFKIYIDEFTPDQVISVDKNKERSELVVQSFKDFIEQNKNEIDALSIIYNSGYANRRLTYEKISELADKMRYAKPPLEIAALWRAFEMLEQDKVRKVKDPVRLLTNLVQLVRFAIGKDDMLEEFDTVANTRYNLWLGRQIKRGIVWTAEQRGWLDMIKDYIILNSSINKSDIQEAFGDKGGALKAEAVFEKIQNNDDALDMILDDLSVALQG